MSSNRQLTAFRNRYRVFELVDSLPVEIERRHPQESFFAAVRVCKVVSHILTPEMHVRHIGYNLHVLIKGHAGGDFVIWITSGYLEKHVRNGTRDGHLVQLGRGCL